MTEEAKSLRDLCEARLRLVEREKRLLKLHHQIPLEILLTLAAAGGQLKINDLYERVDATAAAVRIHLRGMEQESLIESERSRDDRRVKYLKLTPVARSLLFECLQAIAISLPCRPGPDSLGLEGVPLT
jgi:DNA-binding MarR family transcriptional regulator